MEPTGAAPLRPTDLREIGPYRLLGRLGEGGMGTVFLARAPTGRFVAVKVVKAEFANQDGFAARFHAEVENARRVASFCTAQVLDNGNTGDGRPYMVTEYIAGTPLSDQISSFGALDPGPLHGVALGVAAALAAIHVAGLVHRDLKPANVILSLSGPRVIDFGIARALDRETGFTMSGELLGSPGWWAPEQVKGYVVTPAADIFAWGCLVAYAGNGRHPFGRGDPITLATRVLHTQPDLGALPAPLNELARRATAMEPEQRPTAQELLIALVGGSAPAPAASVNPPTLVAPGLMAEWEPPRNVVDEPDITATFTTPPPSDTMVDRDPSGKGRAGSIPPRRQEGPPSHESTPPGSSQSGPGPGRVPSGPPVQGGSVPGVSVPGGSVPGGSVPGGSVPSGSVPGVSLPSGSVPGGSLSGGEFAGQAQHHASAPPRDQADAPARDEHDRAATVNEPDPAAEAATSVDGRGNSTPPGQRPGATLRQGPPHATQTDPRYADAAEEPVSVTELARREELAVREELARWQPANYVQERPAPTIPPPDNPPTDPVYQRPRSTRWLIAAAAALLAITVTGAVLIVTSGRDSASRTAATGSPTASAQPNDVGRRFAVGPAFDDPVVIVPEAPQCGLQQYEDRTQAQGQLCVLRWVMLNPGGRLREIGDPVVSLRDDRGGRHDPIDGGLNVAAIAPGDRIDGVFVFDLPPYRKPVELSATMLKDGEQIEVQL
ncbi:protein kinase [Nonomuraea sp. NPDC048826]|uniref:serine/threonine-protein kinase n=1 Tax=Nonomuraea sp. NPDC048826 TaxID=3364347 RepID=UPI003713DFC2